MTHALGLQAWNGSEWAGLKQVVMDEWQAGFTGVSALVYRQAERGDCTYNS